MKYLERLAAELAERVPEIFPCPSLPPEGRARPLFYEGIGGTRVFAWVGLPEGASAQKRVPGIVLVHGGGGTAFAHWVNVWTRRGYAAIAMDTCGAMPLPGGEYSLHWPRHDCAGAPGWGAFGEQLTWPAQNQWFTHAVSAVMLGHNLLRSLPEVDADRIGITGVSWGGVLTLLCAGTDPRYRAACPVYACGFLHEKEDWFAEQTAGAPETAKNWWCEEWDASNFIGSIRCPVLWLASTNDGSIFYPRSWQKSTEMAGDLSRRALLIRLKHSHGPCSEEQQEVFRFFDECLDHGERQLRLGPLSEKDGHLCARWQGDRPAGALAVFTVDGNPDWFQKEYLELPAVITEKGTIEADLPEGWRAAYLTAVSGNLNRTTTGFVFSERV